MNVMYNSENYCVVEFPGCLGIEVLDKTTGRAGFLEGAVELKFRASITGRDFSGGWRGAPPLASTREATRFTNPPPE